MARGAVGGIELPSREDMPAAQPTDEVYGAPIRLLIALPGGDGSGQPHVLATTLGQTVAQVKKTLQDTLGLRYVEHDLYIRGTTKPMLDPFSLNDFPSLGGAAHGAADLALRVGAEKKKKKEKKKKRSDVVSPFFSLVLVFFVFFFKGGGTRTCSQLVLPIYMCVRCILS
jgi:hypothetical protein